jgi:hypothetical protein
MLGITPGSHNSIMESNVLLNVRVGSHYDYGIGVTNDIIVNNQFINCSCAIDWYGATFRDTAFASNQIVLTNDGSGNFSTEAFFFHPQPSAFRNLTITGNTVTTTGNFPSPAFIVGYNVHGLLIQGNLVDARLRISLPGFHSGIVITNNHDLAGNPY